MIIACDHPARGALGAAGRPMAMASRTELLDRLVTALARPGRRRAAGHRRHRRGSAAAGRPGGQGRLRLDEPGWPAGLGLRDGRPEHRLRRARARSRPASTGAKMLTRIDLDDPGTVATLEQCGQAVTELNRAELIAMVEPFMSRPGRRQGRQRPVAGCGDQVGAHRPGPRRVQRLHLAEAARGRTRWSG